MKLHCITLVYIQHMANQEKIKKPYDVLKMDMWRKKNIELRGTISSVFLNFELRSEQICSH